MVDTIDEWQVRTDGGKEVNEENKQTNTITTPIRRTITVIGIPIGNIMNTRTKTGIT